MVACRGFVRRNIFASFTRTFNWKRNRRSPVGKRLQQKFGTCVGVSIVRQCSALLKLKGVLKPDEELSIEEFFQRMRVRFPDCCKPEDGYGLGNDADFDAVRSVLVDDGLVLESVNPLRYDFENPKVYTEPLPRRYNISEMSLTLLEGMSASKFERKLLKDLKKKSPLACMMVIYESYNWLCGVDLYDPQKHEKMLGGHAMLMIGAGRSWSGMKRRFRPFFLFQDSNKNRGNKGYLKLRRGKELIHIFVTMKA